MNRIELPDGAVMVSSHMPARLARLREMFDLAWATSRERHAQALGHWLGLGELPVIEFGAVPRHRGKTWKLASVQAFAGDRAMAWIDDELHADAHEWATRRTPPTLLVDVNPEWGLVDAHVERLLRFALEARRWGLSVGRDGAPAELDRTRGGLLGLAVGDALGAPLEGQPRHHVAPVIRAGLEMTGGRGWAPGEWTDDTAMALALAESIAEHGLIDTEDVAGRYIAWATHNGRGIGRATATALIGARDADDARTRARAYAAAGGLAAGNGTVMRAAPIGMATDDPAIVRLAATSDAELTHADPSAAAASVAVCAAIIALRRGRDPLAPDGAGSIRGSVRVSEVIEMVASGDESALADLAGGPGAGACWTTLGVALYATAYLESFEEAMHWAIGLGGDTDTNAAVAGALVATRDGVHAIPDRWLAVLQQRERIEHAATALAGWRRVSRRVGGD